jgi:hypothetical protein
MARQLGGVLSPGSALHAALLGILVIGAVTTGGFYSMSLDAAVPDELDLSARALAVAERGLRDAAELDLRVAADERVTVHTTVSGSTLAAYTISVRVLADTLAFVTSEGRAVAGGEEAVLTLGAFIPIDEP